MNSAQETYLAGNDENVPPGQFRIKQIRAVDGDELSKFNAALGEMVEFSAHLALFHILEKNFAELMTAYQKFQEDFKTSREMNPTINDGILNEINRLLINYLSSFRTVIDHYETRYTRLDRAGSSYLASFKAAASKAYDSSFSYRFMYKLRNYVQHCGLPVEGVSAEVTLAANGGQTANLEVYFERDALLAKFNDWGQVKADLEAQPERIEVSSQLEVFHNEIREVFRILARLELGIIDGVREYLAQLAEEVEAQFPGATPVIADFSQVAKAGGELQTLRVPVGELARIQVIGDALDSDPNYFLGAYR